MTEKTMQDRIINIICTEIMVGVSVEEVKNDSSLINDLHLDSLQIMELITQMEGEFELELDDEDLDFQHFSTVDSLAAFVSSKQ
jgi:acyl carrier protein